MMKTFKLGIIGGLLALLLAGSQVWAGTAAEKLSGSLIGFVGDAAGVPQMGATVLLFNRYDRLIQKVLTNEKGAFGFSALGPDVYSLKVTLASFVPAMKHNIIIQPGMRSFLSINLTSVLSSIELIYNAPANAAIMNDDWKWVLRSSLATRPILRLVPRADIADPDSRQQTASSIFSETRGLFRVSAGDASHTADSQPDLGTAFALATSVLGSNQLQLAGNVGYASRFGLPTAGFRTTFSHTGSDVQTPEVQLTMRQLFLPGRTGAAILGGQQDGVPALRTMSLTVLDKAELGEDLHAVYGFSLESVSFLERLNYFSPFARLTYDLGDKGAIDFGYSNGVPPAELYEPGGGRDLEFQEDLAALAAFPRVSLLSDRARVQRSENFEMGYRRIAGGRTYSAGIYRETISNAALTISGADGVLASDLLPDLFSNSSIFNVGTYKSFGYTASVTQSAGEHLSLTASYGNGGALRTEGRALVSDDPDDLRSIIHSGRRNWAMGRVSGTMPGLGTRFSTSYLWTDYRSLTPAHVYLTQRYSPQTGLNFHIRQPLPAFGGLPGRLEASAELRNMLAQGYLPFSTTDGRQFVMVHSPRSVRGGLSFIF